MPWSFSINNLINFFDEKNPRKISPPNLLSVRFYSVELMRLKTWSWKQATSGSKKDVKWLTWRKQLSKLQSGQGEAKGKGKGYGIEGTVQDRQAKMEDLEELSTR